MDKLVRIVLSKIARGNGDLVFNHEHMLCIDCGAQSLGPETARHKDYCVVTIAGRLLAADKENANG